MKTIQAAQRREEIINTAFRVWGDNFFYKTSLSSLAKSLGISKTALYRYFDSKESLIRAMRETLLCIHRDLCQRFHEETEGKDFKHRLDLFDEIILQFYGENYWYFRFIFIYFIPQSEDSFQKLKQLKQLQKELFPLDQLEAEFGWNKKELPVVQSYISASGIFLLFHNSMRVFSSEKVISDEIGALQKKILLEGFSQDRILKEIDYKRIENRSWVKRNELLEQDRIFTAIAKVVSEDGLWKASLEKIADQAGMSKSSLYFHFKNKNDMLWEMIDRERHCVGQLYLEKSSGLRNMEERLYAYIVVFSSYMRLKTDFLSVMNWFRFQGFKIEVPCEAESPMNDYIQFLKEGLVSGKLRKDIYSPGLMVQWLNHFMVQEIHDVTGPASLTKQRSARLRTFYQLFLYGVGGSDIR